MDYSGVKRISTVVTENQYFENRVGEAERPSAPISASEKKDKKAFYKLPSFKRSAIGLNLFKRIKDKLDVYDAIMIPVGVGILVAFIMLILKVV
ncbi:MAG: hypothetical protein LBQ40_00980 [Clostridiales bacterium]|jgi:hypothetical protein|nr:hypothetical protein [Clostridiales bacterium]